MRKNLGFLVSVMLLSVLVLPIFSVKEAEAAPASLRIISPHTEGIRKEYERAFDAYYFSKYGDHVKTEWIDVGGTSDIIAYVDSAYKASGETTCNIDIWWGGGVDPFLDQKTKGHLYSYKVTEANLKPIPTNIGGVPMYDTKDYTWFGTALSGFGIVYNIPLLKLKGFSTPKTWEDLTDPRLRGWVGSADPRHSGSTHMCYEIILQGYGWVEGLKISTTLGANVKTWPQSSSAVPKAVSAGDVAYGLAIDFYAWSEVSKIGADKIGYVMPEGLTVVNPDSIAILKGAPNLSIAKEFVEYTLSKDGQKLWMLPVNATGGPTKYLLGRMCVIPELYTELGGQSVVPINPFAMKSQLKYNETLGSLRYVLLNDLIGSMIIDSQADLATVWQEIIVANKTVSDAGVTSAHIKNAINLMGSAPVTETEALKLTGSWADQTIRNRYITEWRAFALKKYKDASEEARLAGTDVYKSIQERERYFQGLLTQAQVEKQNNLYMGLGGGIVIGIVIGAAVAYYATRKKEIAAVRA